MGVGLDLLFIYVRARLTSQSVANTLEPGIVAGGLPDEGEDVPDERHLGLEDRGLAGIECREEEPPQGD